MDFAAARSNMIESQLRCNRVTDPTLLATINRIDREAFLEEDRRRFAYVDTDLPLGSGGGKEGRYMVAPLVFGRLAQMASVQKDDSLLLVGGGSFYEAAVLAGLVSTLFVVEEDASLAELGQALLPEMGIDNVVIETGPHRDGFAGAAPFSRIFVNGEVAGEVDHPQKSKLANLFKQLSDGGLLVAVMGSGGPGKACVFQRDGNAIVGSVKFDADTLFLKGFEPDLHFSF